MAAMFWREPAMTHAVFALHWSAFYFVLATIRRVFGNLGTWGAVVSALGILVELAYLVIAMRTTYRRGWLGSALRAVVTLVLFALLLVGWLWSTTTVAAGIAAWGGLR